MAGPDARYHCQRAIRGTAHAFPMDALEQMAGAPLVSLQTMASVSAQRPAMAITTLMHRLIDAIAANG